MPYNLLLLPLIAGYFLLVYSVFFKYNIQRFSQNRLLFESVFTSVIILFITFILRTLLDLIFPNITPTIINFLKIVPIKKVDYLWTAVFSFIITIILVLLTNLLVIRIKGKTAPISWAVDKNGDEIEKLFKRSVEEGVLIQITLKNNKVYIGFSEIIPEPQKTNYIILTPIISGYRESDTKKIIITTDYFKVVDKFITTIEAEGAEVDEIKLNTDVIIRQDEILTAGIYEQEIFDRFNNSQVVPN